MEFHSIRELRHVAEGEGAAAQQARLRILWFERGRADAVRGATMRHVYRFGRLVRDAYIDGFTSAGAEVTSTKSRKPLPLRAGSAEVRNAR